MGEPIVYGPAYSTYARTVRMCLEEKGVPYRLEEVDILKGAGKSPEHLARHPFGKVPAFEHDGFAIYETGAIARYIEDAFDGPKLLPADLRRRARVNQAAAVADAYLYVPLVQRIFIQRLVAPMLGGSTDEAVVSAAVPQAEQALDALGKIMPDLPTDSVTLADLFLLPIIEYGSMTPEGKRMLEARPALAQWAERAGQRPSAAKTRPSFG